jgi:hypothetical protein
LLRLLGRIYRLMLRAYPSTFWREYGREMPLAFENQAREVVQDKGSWALLPFWLHIVWDWLRTIVSERNDMEPNDLRSWNLRLTFAIALIPTIAYVLHDLVFQLPDNAHEATLGFFVTPDVSTAQELPARLTTASFGTPPSVMACVFAPFTVSPRVRPALDVVHGE